MSIKKYATALRKIKSDDKKMASYRVKKNILKFSAQDTVPIHAIHENENLIESYPGFYTRMYKIIESNYQVETEETQQAMFIDFRSFFNAIDDNIEIQISIFNKNVNIEQFSNEILLKETGDELDGLRNELNNINLARMQDGKNGLVKCKYMTVGIHTDSLINAKTAFKNRIDAMVQDGLKKIQSDAIQLTMPERLEILHDIYNIDEQGEFLTTAKITDDDGNTKTIKSFDIENIRGMGLSVNDLIAPSSVLKSSNGVMILGKKYVRVFRVQEYATCLSDEFAVSLTDVNFNILSTISVQPIPTKNANKIVKINLKSANSAVADQRISNIKQNFPEDMISPELKDDAEHAAQLRQEMMGNNEKLFKTIHTIVVYADSLDQLNEYSDILKSNCQGRDVYISRMDNLQEEGFNAALPLLYVDFPHYTRRTLKSSSVTCASNPFSYIEITDPDGIPYSMHLKNRNLIVYNRLLTQNFNGFIFGTPGSGKSFTAKTEMLYVRLNSNAKCIIIDPESEYGALAKQLGGETIKIMPGGKWHINPMEINTAFANSESENEQGENPVQVKSDFILKLMEVILKSPFGLTSIHETIIDECVRKLYSPFIDRDGQLTDISKDKMPTLTDLQIEFGKRQEPESRELSIALKLYTGEGSLNAFGSQSNVDINNDFIVYDIKDVGDRLKPIAMLIILDSIQHELFSNRKKGRNTWFWVDECHLLFQDDRTAAFLNALFKRARKYGGVPTGITQNVQDLLKSDTVCQMLSNCNFIQMLNQAQQDREKLQQVLHLSDAHMKTLTSAPKGQGLIYTGTHSIPFYSVFPKNSPIYRCLTSNMKELAEYDAEDKTKTKKKNGIA